jgi:ParB family chromosome partitioning protein
MATRRGRGAEVAIVRPAQPRTDPQAIAGATERRLAGALEVPLNQVVPDADQPRHDWQHDDGERRLKELAASVREEGTLPDGRQRYVVVAGGRRLAAAAMAGLTTLPVVVSGQEPARVRVLQLIENLQRQNLSPLDEGRAYQELIDLRGIKPTEVAALIHVSAQHVRDRLRLLADQVLADAVARRQISATAARDIRQLPDEVMMEFRNRVLAGEHLQTNDIAVARARLAAEGVINPRRKIARPDLPEHALPSPTAVPFMPEQSEKQTSFVRPPEAQEQPSSAARAGVAPGETALPAPSLPAVPLPPVGHEMRPDMVAAAPVQERPAEQTSFVPPVPDQVDLRAVAAVTLAGLDPEARAQVRGLVAAAADLGWSCAALLDLLQQLA